MKALVVVTILLLLSCAKKSSPITISMTPSNTFIIPGDIDCGSEVLKGPYIAFSGMRITVKDSRPVNLAALKIKFPAGIHTTSDIICAFGADDLAGISAAGVFDGSKTEFTFQATSSCGSIFCYSLPFNEKKMETSFQVQGSAKIHVVANDGNAQIPLSGQTPVRMESLP